LSVCATIRTATSPVEGALDGRPRRAAGRGGERAGGVAGATSFAHSRERRARRRVGFEARKAARGGEGRRCSRGTPLPPNPIGPARCIPVFGQTFNARWRMCICRRRTGSRFIRFAEVLTSLPCSAAMPFVPNTPQSSGFSLTTTVPDDTGMAPLHEGDVRHHRESLIMRSRRSASRVVEREVGRSSSRTEAARLVESVDGGSESPRRSRRRGEVNDALSRRAAWSHYDAGGQAGFR